MKTVKAWAVLDPDGRIHWDAIGPWIYKTKHDAVSPTCPDTEVVRVEIREVPKGKKR